MAGQVTTSELARRVDDFRSDFGEKLDKIGDAIRDLRDQYAPKDVTELRLAALEESKRLRDEADAIRQREAANTRRMVYIAIFSAICGPILVALLLGALK